MGRQRAGRHREVPLPRPLLLRLLLGVLSAYQEWHPALYLHPAVLAPLPLLVRLLSPAVRAPPLLPLLRGPHPLPALVQLAGLVLVARKLNAVLPLAVPRVAPHLFVVLHALLEPQTLGRLPAQRALLRVWPELLR